MEYLTSFFASTPSIFQQKKEIKFYIQDEEHLLKSQDISPEMTLNSYLREKALLTGTKKMCVEGGCGACIVAVSFEDPVTKQHQTVAVNSCLLPIYVCSGWKIYTVEKIGDPATGYHPVQKAMVQFSGTQCGFCTPGMLMNMYALYESGEFKMAKVENDFGGNICRCTGYRSILTAFKSLAKDASEDLLGKYCDIEDIPLCKITPGACNKNCIKPIPRQPHYFTFGEAKWFKVFTINEILDIFANFPNLSYMLVGGNTATGVYRRGKFDLYIDINSVENLKNHVVQTDKLILGANMSLTNAIKLFYELAEQRQDFVHLKKMADHIDLIANVPVRNTGTLAGNLFTKHEHHEFPSDIFLILETIGATLTLVGKDRKEFSKSLVDYLTYDMKEVIIKHIVIPSYDSSYKFESYKIMPRAQNAHALVNAGFLLQLTENQVVKSARIVYGSINPTFVHATNAENYLINKTLYDDQTLQKVFKTLEEEVVPDDVLPEPKPEFRKQLAISLFHKFVLSIAPEEKVSPVNKSGGLKQVRAVSSGTQDFKSNESLYPVSQAIPKLEALVQSTGKAQYIMDIPDQPHQLFAAFVLAKAPAHSTITQIDASKALELSGVVQFYDKSSIPGKNDFTPPHSGFTQKSEELFCSGVVKYYFQPVGIIVAESQEVAEEAAELVEITYATGKDKPLVTIRDILANNAQNKIFPEGKKEAKSKGDDVKHVIKGKYDVSWQYHYTMETQCCVVIPTEDGLDMFPSSQDMNLSQNAASVVLNIPANKINVTVRRLGGGYGAKITRNSLVSSAAALAAYKLQRPVKLALPLITNMNIVGKRFPMSADYEVGVDDKGKIQYMNTSMYTDLGNNGDNENGAAWIMAQFVVTYDDDTWNLKMYSTRSDCPSGCSCRAPSTTESIGLGETIMQHIATDLSLDPVSVRLENIKSSASEVRQYVDELLKWAEVDQRKKEAEEFNKVNRWIKRGIAVVPMKYDFNLFGNWHAHVSVFQMDGSVAISHGGIEMGQGINTKVAQVCAYSLGIPLDQVSVKPSQNLIAPNNMTSGGSFTSEAVCCAVINSCNILKERMKPIKDSMKEDATWKEIVQECYKKDVDLNTSFMYHTGLPDIKSYPIYGATCAEVEIDILTGLTQIKRVDIIEDTGDSLSPLIDIGQVEGAFIMGLGYWTSEQIVYDSQGKLMTNRTWTYKPPGAKDIPVDFRVKFPKDNPNHNGILNSKATAEPPLCMTIVVPLAIRDAVASARAASDPTASKWYPIDGPSTVENTFMESLNNYQQYKL